MFLFFVSMVDIVYIEWLFVSFWQHVSEIMTVIKYGK